MIYTLETYFAVLAAVALLTAGLLVPAALLLLVVEGWKLLLQVSAQLLSSQRPARAPVAPAASVRD